MPDRSRAPRCSDGGPVTTEPEGTPSAAFAAAARLGLPRAGGGTGTGGTGGPGTPGGGPGTPGGGPGTPGGTAPPGGPTWGELADWAAWLEETYGIGLIICWPRHPGVVEELVALLAARLDAEPKQGRALADWHSLLAAAATRMRDALGACTAVKHEPSAHRRLDPATVLLPEGAALGGAVPAR